MTLRSAVRLAVLALALNAVARPSFAQVPTWLQQCPSSSPSPRFSHAMAYDAVLDEVVLFGGADANSASLDDTWIWDGTNWTERFPATSPTARSGHAMAYDAARGEVVLFGGSSPSGPLGDTWVWNGSTWTQRFPTASPPARFNGGFLAYDAVRQQVVLFGGGPGTPSPCRFSESRDPAAAGFFKMIPPL